MRPRSSLLVIFAFLLLLAACNDPSPATQEKSHAVTLIPITFDRWQEKLATYERDIVVVDVWATWCLPCLEQFPRMVELERRLQMRGVRFVSMSLDDRGDTIAVRRAREFLVREKAAFENYLMDEGITDAFQKLGLQSIPAVLIYDREGRLRHKLTRDDPNDQFTIEDVRKAIEGLLGTFGQSPTSSSEKIHFLQSQENTGLTFRHCCDTMATDEQ